MVTTVTIWGHLNPPGSGFTTVPYPILSSSREGGIIISILQIKKCSHYLRFNLSLTPKRVLFFPKSLHPTAFHWPLSWPGGSHSYYVPSCSLST